MASKKRISVKALLTTIGVLVIGGITAYIYTKGISGKSKESETNAENERFKDKSALIVLSPSVIAANLPFLYVLQRNPNLVLILPPNLKKNDLKEYHIDIDDSYKVIECDTQMGIFHVLKQLKCHYNFICQDDIDEPEKKFELFKLRLFLPYVIVLDQNNEMIHQEFWKHLLY